MPIDSSKFFDSIRIKPNKLSAKQQAQAREASAMCEWPDCKNKGPHQRQGILALLSQSRPRIQPVLQFLPGHECRRGCALSEGCADRPSSDLEDRSEEHTSELQSRLHLVCRLLLEK